MKTTTFATSSGLRWRPEPGLGEAIDENARALPRQLKGDGEANPGRRGAHKCRFVLKL
jgi:hypothetical protein